MGIGPVPAIRGLLGKADMKIDDIDQVEINEAFGAQALSCQKELEIDMAVAEPVLEQPEPVQVGEGKNKFKLQTYINFDEKIANLMRFW